MRATTLHSLATLLSLATCLPLHAGDAGKMRVYLLGLSGHVSGYGITAYVNGVRQDSLGDFALVDGTKVPFAACDIRVGDIVVVGGRRNQFFNFVAVDSKGQFLFCSDPSWAKGVLREGMDLVWLASAESRADPNVKYKLRTKESLRLLDSIGMKRLSSRLCSVYCKAGDFFVKRQIQSVDLKPDPNLVAADLLVGLLLKQGPAEAVATPARVCGTGWFCADNLIVTCNHVVRNKARVTVFAGSRPGALAQIVARDAEHDLAVLLVPKTLDSPPCLPVNPSPPAMGERVFTIGYPHIALQGQAPKFTDGTVSSLTGFMDEPSTLQVSVPVQSGNSGGPLLNSRGGVVGVVAAKLEAAKVFDWTGDLPQNVNYAIKATYVLRLLAPLQESAEGKVLATQAGPVEEVVRRVKDSVVLIVAE